MSVEERIELLKSNILHYTKDLLNFDVVEIRLLDQKTGRLEPLLVGGHGAGSGRARALCPAAGQRRDGFRGGHGQELPVRGHDRRPALPGGVRRTPRVRSPCRWCCTTRSSARSTSRARSRGPSRESDLQFLEIFTRDVAVALNTLELLVAEKASTAAASVEAIHSAVALPVDEILNDAVNVMERYIGHEPEVVERLQRILRNARDIKQVIQMVGPEDGPGPGPAAAAAGRRAASAAGPAGAPGRRRRRASAARPTRCWSVTAASSRPPPTAPRPSSWSAT